MTSTEPSRKGKLLPHLGSGSVGAVVGGLLTGMYARLSHGEGLPLDTFDWVLKNGVAGFALAGMAIMGLVTWRTMREKDRAIERYGEKQEQNYREQLARDRKLVRLVALCTEAIRGLPIVESDLREIDDTPESGTPLPRKEG